jgi:hypothetical protein
VKQIPPQNRRLYLPTGETVFRCRLCCDLTYLSSQEHNTRHLRPFLEMIRSYLGDADSSACTHL